MAPTAADSPGVLAVQLGHHRPAQGRHAPPRQPAGHGRRPTAATVLAHPARRPLPVGGQAVLRLRAGQLADVPVLGRRHRRANPARPTPAERGRPGCAPSSPTLFFASPGLRRRPARRRHPPTSLRLGAAAPSPPARPCPPTCSGASPSASAFRCSTGSAPPRRSTSSCPTPRAPSGRAPAARRSRATRLKLLDEPTPR